MKKLFIAAFASLTLGLVSCGHSTDNTTTHTDTVTPGPDSSANNGIIPPSASPSNAGNSSLADTAYHKKDSVK